MQPPEDIVPHAVISEERQSVHLGQVEVFDVVDDHLGTVKLDGLVQYCLKVLRCLHKGEDYVQNGVHPVQRVVVRVVKESRIVALFER